MSQRKEDEKYLSTWVILIFLFICNYDIELLELIMFRSWN